MSPKLIPSRLLVSRLILKRTPEFIIPGRLGIGMGTGTEVGGLQLWGLMVEMSLLDVGQPVRVSTSISFKRPKAGAPTLLVQKREAKKASFKRQPGLPSWTCVEIGKREILEMSVKGGVWLVYRRIGTRCDGDNYHRQAKFSARKQASQPASHSDGYFGSSVKCGQGISRAVMGHVPG